MATTNNIFRVVQSGDIETFDTANTGNIGNCRQLMLQELGAYTSRDEQGNKLAGTLVVKTYGSLALCQFYPGDVVVASIRFDARRSKEGNWYQTITASDIVKIA